MKKKIILKPLFLFISTLTLFSCASRKDLAYYQDIDTVTSQAGLSDFEPQLQPDDLLMIVVQAETPEIAAPFNMPLFSLQGNTESATPQQRLSTYLIDAKGNIEFPVIGQLHLAGLTRAAAIETLKEKLKKYIANPTVNMRILNFKVTVQGEVNRPGTHTIASERLTLIEALSMSGDLTVYGKRDNILVLREEDGKKTAGRVDLTKSDFIDSPYYYLSQNDVVYVEPNKTKINASAVGPNTSVIISAISLLITVIAITLK